MDNDRRPPDSEAGKKVNADRRVATLVGIFFIFASATAILGFLFYQPILTGPDYLINGAAHSNRVILGALMELTLAVTAIGTAIGLFPILKPYGERIALTHLFFRFLEAVVITVGVVAILSLLTFSQDFVAAADPDVSTYSIAGSLLHAVYKWTSILGPLLFLGINTMMYSSLLYKSKLVPRPLAAMGLAGATLVLAYAMLVLFGASVQGASLGTLLAMPIALYEMILAGWLIIKGFNPAARVVNTPKTGMDEALSAA
jgi:hypothetical protein